MRSPSASYPDAATGVVGSPILVVFTDHILPPRSGLFSDLEGKTVGGGCKQGISYTMLQYIHTIPLRVERDGEWDVASTCMGPMLNFLRRPNRCASCEGGRIRGGGG